MRTLNKMDKARNFYEKAVSFKANEAITPFYLKKLAMFYERDQKTDKARSAYQRIKTEFPSSSEATDIDKYLARLEGK
ncbi:MAG: tetratricopeptide repeat protein [Haliscomenobacter sp.]|nr:tetratricopeptide repeat protein [Haliscomenobacter sp.]